MAEAGHVSCLRALLAAGANPDLLRTRDGSAALHYAAIGNMRQSNEECVRVLLDGIYRTTPLALPVDWTSADNIEAPSDALRRLQLPAHSRLLLLAAGRCCSHSVARSLFPPGSACTGGADPNLRRVSDDVPPLHLAAQSGR